LNPDWQSRGLAIIGAGVLGAGVAAVAVGHGVPVVLVDVDQDALDRARIAVRTQLRHGRALGVLPSGRPTGRLVTTLSMPDVAGASAVVEAVTERAVVKTKALAAVCRVVGRGTPLISCTSGIPVDEIADWSGRPEDVVGAHFMNPPYLIRKVELAHGPRTADETVAAVTGLLASLGREAVPVRDSSGSVAARILYPMINAAARIAAEEKTGTEEVDALMGECFRQPGGPLRTADLIGIDSLVYTLEAIYARTGDERYQPCDALLEKLHAGELGRKSGRGFYGYSDDEV
jgi:methoxymalonate biosynthesis protein